MKKFFPTFIDQTVENCETFCFSAGKIGYQIETDLQTLAKMIRFTLADLTEEAQ